MNYLITGHNGFIGQSYINYLLFKDKSVNILGLSRNTRIFPKGNIQEINIELADKNLSNVVTKFNPDIIIHLASQRFGSLDDLITSNVKATENLFNAAIKLNKQVKIILIGSSAEIGIPNRNPILEDDKCTPVDYYGLTKLMQSELAHQFHIKYGLQVIRLRLFNVIGAGMPNSLLAGKAIKAFNELIKYDKHSSVSFGDLSSFRDYLDIRDICSAIDLAIINGNSGNLYNIGSGTPTQGVELIEKIIKACPYKSAKLDFVFDRLAKSIVPCQMADIIKANEHLKWQPLYSLNQTIEWMWDRIINNEN